MRSARYGLGEPDGETDGDPDGDPDGDGGGELGGGVVAAAVPMKIVMVWPGSALEPTAGDVEQTVPGEQFVDAEAGVDVTEKSYGLPDRIAVASAAVWPTTLGTATGFGGTSIVTFVPTATGVFAAGFWLKT